MPKVTLGRKRLKTAGIDDNSPSSIKPYSRPTRSTVNGNNIDIATPSFATPTSASSTSSKCKVSNIKRLEALARATTKLKIDFENATPLVGSKECLPWVDRNFPKTLNELFVHKKKVNDVKAWMESALGKSQSMGFSGKTGKMCILTGPTGSGKTATAYLVAKELEAEVKEWINPMNLTQFQENRTAAFGDEVFGRSQLDLFADFLLRSSQYSSLPLKGKKHFDYQVVVVEDFPNGFYRDTQAFHNLLRNYAAVGVSPVVFIIPDNASGECNPIKLFPKQLTQELNITQFTFNAVAMSLMTKFLICVCNRENVTVEQSVLEGVASASSGDMRCAINTLQFKILQERPKETGVFKRPLPKSTKLRRDKILKSQDLTQKDTSLFLFRALGKVLYNKRDRSTESAVELQLDENLAEHRRPYVSQEVPEEIASHIEVSTETFMGFLHQNYPNFFGSVETCAKAASYLADSEVLLSRWTFEENSSSGGTKHYKNQDTREQLALSLGIRGLMHANDHKVSNEWRPLRKPLCGDIRTKVQKIFNDAREIFPTQDSVIQSYYYETLPYYGKIKGQFLPPERRNFIRELCTYKDAKQLNRSKWLETLDEKSAVLEDESDSTEDELASERQQTKDQESLVKSSSSGNSQSNVIGTKSADRNSQECGGDGMVEQPEDFRIDDFDDDD